MSNKFTIDHFRFVERELRKNQSLQSVYDHCHALPQTDNLFFDKSYDQFRRYYVSFKKARGLQTSDYDLLKSADQLLLLTDLVNSSALKPIDRLRCLESLQRIQEREDTKAPPPITNADSPKEKFTLDHAITIVCALGWQLPVVQCLFNKIPAKDRYELMAKYLHSLLTAKPEFYKYDWSVFGLPELDKLILELQQVKANKLGVSLSAVVPDSLNGYETKAQRVARLKIELSTLSEQDIEEIEKAGESNEID